MKHLAKNILGLLALVALLATQATTRHQDKEALEAMRNRLHRLEKIVDQKEYNIDKAKNRTKVLEKKIGELVHAYGANHKMLPKNDLLRETREFNPEICVFMDKNRYGATDAVRYIFPALNVGSYKTQFTVWVQWDNKNLVVHRDTQYEDEFGSRESISNVSFKKAM